MVRRTDTILRMGAALATAGFAMLSGCVEAPKPPVQPAVRPVPQAAPPPQVQLPPPEWQDLPIAPGSWSYRTDALVSEASFTPVAGGVGFAMRCDRQSQLIKLSRAGATGGAMRLRTSTDERNLTAVADPGPPPVANATLPASDPFLDAIAFSRGRFSVEMAGTAMLVIPAWSEPSAVIEDCRG